MGLRQSSVSNHRTGASTVTRHSPTTGAEEKTLRSTLVEMGRCFLGLDNKPRSRAVKALHARQAV